MKRGGEESYASSTIPYYVGLEIRVDRVDRNTINSSRFLVISYMEQKLFWKSITRTGRIEISFDKGISAIFLNLNLFEIKKMEEENVFLECIFDFYRSSY